jgi:hypothetical protein
MRMNVPLHQEAGVLEPLVLALACSLALAVVFEHTRPFADEGKEPPQPLSVLLTTLRERFASRGVRFNPAGVPLLPSLTPDLSRLDALAHLLSLALREAHMALINEAIDSVSSPLVETLVALAGRSASSLTAMNRRPS